MPKLLSILLLTPLLIAQTKPATAPAIDMAGASADLKARASWLRGEIKRISDLVEAKPSTKGRQSISAAKESLDIVDTVVAASISNLMKVKADKEKFPRNVMLARVGVNDVIDQTLTQLKETGEQVHTPIWMSPASQVPAAAVVAIDSKLSTSVAEAWKKAFPNATGLGEGVEGRERSYSVTQGQTIAGLGELLSARVSFRINPNKGNPIVTPTSLSIMIVLSGDTTFGNSKFADGAVLERRLSQWWSRAPAPDINAADPPRVPASGPAATRGK
jgi:hypothetical protein